jgi:glucokinase
MDDWVIGIDLGATKIALGLVDPNNRIVARRRILTENEKGPASVVARIGENVQQLKKEAPAHVRVAAVGICSPGPVDFEEGLIVDPPNIVGLHHSPLRRMLADHLDLPVSLEHDAKAAALGDFHYGAGKRARSMVFVVVGTGVGAALILDGTVYRGENNYAGEIGHMTIDRHGERCHCGTRGCVETFLSGPQLARHFVRLRREAGEEVDPESITGDGVAALAAEGDPVARQVMYQAGEALGIAVANVAMTVNVDLYVIGGSVVKSGDLLLEPAREVMKCYCFSSVGQNVRIVPTTLGDDGPILGCAWLARQVAGS